jgi:hypothetical protein
MIEQVNVLLGGMETSLEHENPSWRQAKTFEQKIDF